MGIQMIGGMGGISPYYKAPKIPVVTPEEVRKQDLQQQEEQIISPDYSADTPKPDLRSRPADLENISLTFNKEESFDYIGSESGLADLDMQKAISDMRKDQVLQEYQYFVGSAQNFLQSTEDGIVISKAAL